MGEHVADPHRAAGRLGRCVRRWPATGRAACAADRAAHAGRSRWRPATASSRFVPLGIGKSVVIDLPRDIKDVLVADPKIANAVVRSARRAYIIGAAVGQTNVFFFDAERPADRRLRHRGDARSQRLARRDQAGAAGADIRVEGAGRGRRAAPATSSSPIEAQQAFDIASRLVDDGQQGRQRHHRARPRPGHAQGHGRRSAARRHQAARHRSHRQRRLRLGGARLQHHQSVPGLRPAAGSHVERHHRHAGKSVTATLRAMERAGVIRTLAEPNLTAISGESANFLAGGEFPVPAGYTCAAAADDRNCQYTDPVQEIRRRPELHAGRAGAKAASASRS